MLTSASGITGLDNVLMGGFPAGRPTIVLGRAGSGKTVLAMQYLANGATRFDEPGLMISFEESPAALQANFPGIGWPSAEEHGGVQLLDGRLPEDAVEAGAFDLGGLIAVASSIVKQHGIKRLAIDGIDALFALSEDPANKRREILRLINWLTDSGLTSLMTMKMGDGSADSTAYFELAEFAADSVIQLKKTPVGELKHRSLSVVKMRGSTTVEGEHPYVISASGIHVLYTPTRTDSTTKLSERRLSTGIERLDTMLAGGYRVGTTTLISGLPGTSKTTLGLAFLEAGCRAGETGLFVGFDEPSNQAIFDARSLGIDLDGALQAGLLHTVSYNAGAAIGDAHYLAIEALLDAYQPARVVIDPATALEKSGGQSIADAITERLVLLLKSRGITAIFTAIAESRFGEIEGTMMRISTVADTWMHLSFANRGGERNRTLTIVKSRGTAHSNQMRELLLSPAGIDLADVYAAGGDVLVGTARAQKEQKVSAERDAEKEAFIANIDRLDRNSQDLARALKETQRGLDQLAADRDALVQHALADGLAHTVETDLIRTLRQGDVEPA